MTRRKRRTFVRRPGPDGRLIGETVDLADRAPIRIGCYSPAERLMILELAVLMFVQKNPGMKRSHARACFHGHLKVQRCERLYAFPGRHGEQAQFYSIVDALAEQKLFEPMKIKGRFIEKPLTLTAKGKRHIKRQSKRLQEVASKLVYTDVLERMARV